MRRAHVLIVTAAVLLFLSPAICATTIHVPLDQPSIQEALDAADTGDTVLVAADTYGGALNRDLDFAGKGVTLRGESRDPSVTIDCEGLGRAFHFHSGEDTTAVVESFTIQNAVADSGAGVMCRGGSSPRFFSCRFEGNTATVRGGGVCCLGGAAVLRYCEFDGNDASGSAHPYGGGIACLGGASPVLHGCIFTNNTAASAAGAAYSHGSTPTFNDCSFLANSGADGGGVFGVSSGSLTISNCVFTANTGAQGGAIYTQSCPATVTGCTFREHGYRAVSFLYSTSTGHVSDCTFVDNVNHFYCFDNADAIVSGCTFVGSSATGGGVTVNEASPSFEDCIFAFSTRGPAAHCEGGAESPTFTRCVLFSNAGGDDLCGSVSDTLHHDPNFCDLIGGDFSLCGDSVCAPDNNVWTALIGALDVGCAACGSPVEEATWGSIKGLFR